MTFKRLQEVFGFSLIIAVGLWGRVSASGPARFHSPTGHAELIFETVPAANARVQKAKPGAAKQTTDQYAITLYVTGSSEAVNMMLYSDSSPATTPENLLQSMIWSPHEEFVLVPNKQKAREGGHMFLLAAPLFSNKIWSLEADHPIWIDDRRFVGDVDTKDIPGGIIFFDGNAGKADLLIQPLDGIGYQIAGVTGHVVKVKEMLNSNGTGKTKWDHFEPACFDLDLDTFMKKSSVCPAQ